MANPNFLIVIPARYGSTRLPGKPLMPIAGKLMLQRVWECGAAVGGAERVLIATDDERIRQAAEKFGARVVMTPESCANGSERAFAALQSLPQKPGIVINLQGDSPLSLPWMMSELVDEMTRDASVQVATPAVRLSWAEYDELTARKKASTSSGTTVTFDRNRNALYFSKTPIPYVRARAGDASPVYRHVGIYAYRLAVLERYIGLAATPLETSEGLEQLRLLEHGIPIRVVETSMRGRTNWSVDTPQDIAIVEEILKREGELPGDGARR